MTDPTQSVEQIEADNTTKRAVLASLKAVEANIVMTGALDDRTSALLQEGKLLDGQIDEQLAVVAGHSGVASTDMQAAKAQMLAAVEKQVKDAQDAQDAALKEAQAKADADAKAANEAAAAAASQSTGDVSQKVDTVLNLKAADLPVPPTTVATVPPASESGAPLVPPGQVATPPAADGVLKPVYTHVGDGPIDQTAWLKASTQTADDKPLYNYSGDTDVTPTGASAEWVVYTETQKGL